MGNIEFVHAADLHIDSPLRGLERYEGAPKELLQGATRSAFAGLIDLCLERNVDLLLLAGDLFDGDWKDMNTGLFAIAQLKRLGDIPVCVIRGNHDAKSQISRELRFPPNTTVFSSRRPETKVFDSLGLAVHGQSFPKREVTENLALDYPDPVSGLLNIGLLHTSLTGAPDHDPYAPARLEELVTKGYEYWALGHIHQRRVFHRNPYVVMAGNTQGRHIKEAGAKGCTLVRAEDGEISTLEFLPTDVARWFRVRIKLASESRLDDLYREIGRAFEECRSEGEGRLAAVRVHIDGACAAHDQLLKQTQREEAIAEIRNLANDLDGAVWVEKVSLRTRPRIDLEELRKGGDLIGDVLSIGRQASSNPDLMNELFEELASLGDKAASELAQAGVDLADPHQRKRWLEDAQSLLVSLLGDSSS